MNAKDNFRFERTIVEWRSGDVLDLRRHMIRSTRVQKSERVRAARRLLAAGTSMAEAAVTLSRNFGLSRRQAYRYLEEAQLDGPPSAPAEAPVPM